MRTDEARRVLITDDGTNPGAARALSRGTAARTYLRLRRGVYVDGAVWGLLGKEERLLLRMVALQLTSRTRPVFSHWAAALLHGLPVARRMAHLVDVAVDGGRNRSTSGTRTHLLTLDPDDVVEVDGLLCTSIARTAVDIAADAELEQAVAVADPACALLGADGQRLLGEALERSGRRRGIRSVRVVLAFADARSGSPGESISRWRMRGLGFVAPELQVEIVTDGRSEFGDFGWERYLALGEFDGEVKYRDDRYRLGGEVQDVVVREKNRENRMRRQRPNFARWDWTDLLEGRLEGILRGIGIPKRDDDA